MISSRRVVHRWVSFWLVYTRYTSGWSIWIELTSYSLATYPFFVCLTDAILTHYSWITANCPLTNYRIFKCFRPFTNSRQSHLLVPKFFLSRWPSWISTNLSTSIHLFSLEVTNYYQYDCYQEWYCTQGCKYYQSIFLCFLCLCSIFFLVCLTVHRIQLVKQFDYGFDMI